MQSLCFTRIPSLKTRLLPFSLHSSPQSCERCRLWHRGIPGLPGRRRLFPNSYVSHSCQIKTPLLRRIITPSPCSTVLVGLKFLHPHCPEKQKHNPPCACPMVLWAKLCPLQKSYVEALTPNVTEFGHWVFKEVINIK